LLCVVPIVTSTDSVLWVTFLDLDRVAFVELTLDSARAEAGGADIDGQLGGIQADAVPGELRRQHILQGQHPETAGLSLSLAQLGGKGDTARQASKAFHAHLLAGHVEAGDKPVLGLVDDVHVQMFAKARLIKRPVTT
jgi:hypothetical protein